MATTTTPEPGAPGGRITDELARQIHALSRDAKAQLVVWLQEELDGQPGGELPEPPADDPGAVKAAWRDELAARVRDVQEGRVVLVDAREAVAKLRQRVREKFGA